MLCKHDFPKFPLLLIKTPPSNVQEPCLIFAENGTSFIDGCWRGDFSLKFESVAIYCASEMENLHACQTLEEKRNRANGRRVSVNQQKRRQGSKLFQLAN